MRTDRAMCSAPHAAGRNGIDQYANLCQSCCPPFDFWPPLGGNH